MSAAPVGQPASDAPNHPNSLWMAIIAGMSFNLVVGCATGSFSVMMEPAAERMHVSTAMAGLAAPVFIVGSALVAYVAGELATRFSLRVLMFAGALLSLAAFLILAFTSSYAVYLACYALLLGPSMSLAGSVGPATLVTRWFNRNRGLALGLVNLAVANTIIPVASRSVLNTYGASATYLAMAVAIGVVLVPLTLLIRDYPPGTEPQPAAAAAGRAPPADTVTAGQLLRQGKFWAFSMAAAITITGTMVLTFNMTALMQARGIDADRGAVMLTIMSFAGMAGSILFGWIADRIGGVRGLALLAADCAILFGLLLFDLPFPLLVAVVALLGLHGAGTIPNVSRALADTFGAASYSRAFGMSTAFSVPVTVVVLLLMNLTYSWTGSYVPTMIGLVACFLVVIAPLLAGQKPRASASPG